MPVPIAAIFVSSTWVDLQPERAAVEKALHRFHEAKFVGMEYLGSRDETTRRASLDEVDRSQLYVGIFAARYGSGITEAEYRRARERQLDCLIYFKAEDAIAPEMRDADAASAQRLAGLKEELRHHTVTTFSTADDLAVEVTADVHRWLFDKFLKERLQQESVGEIFSSKTGEINASGAEAFRLQVGSSLGSVLYAAATPAPRRRTTPLLPNVRRFRGLIDRTIEVETTLAALPTAIPIEIHGETGVGKTVLLRTIAYHPNLTGNPDGVVYLDRVGGEPAEDLQQCLYESFYESAPRIKPREGELRQLLREPRALVLLDDVTQPQPELESLFNLLPNCLFCIASEERRLHGEVKAIALTGLSAADALTLTERELGSTLSEKDRAAARQLCGQVDGIPSRVILAIASAKQQSIPLADFGTADESTRSSEQSLRHNIESRNTTERRVLAMLGVLGAFVSKDALAACLPSGSLEAPLEALVDGKLIQIEGSTISLFHGVANAMQTVTDADGTWLEALPRLASWSEQHRANAEALLLNSEVLQRATDWAANHAQWPEVLRLVHALEPTLSASGRWMTWEKLLDLAARASEALGDSASRAWALHQLGSRAICQGERESANNFLQQALALRVELGDHWGAALTRHNLDLLRPPVLPGGSSAPQPSAKHDGEIPTARSKLARIPRVLKLTGLGIVALATGLAAQIFWRHAAIPFRLEFSPPSLEFVSAALNQPSPEQTLSVTNPGNASLTIRNASLSGPSSGAFTLIENRCEAKLLSPGSACSVRLRFTPGSTEPSTARLIFNESGGDQTATIDLRGGIESAPEPTAAPVLSVRPESVEFGGREVGNRGRIEITVINSGNAPLLLGKSSIAGSAAEDFAVARNACANRPIAPQAECAIDLTFTPRAEGVRDAALVLTANDGARQQITLRGAGISRPVGAIRAEPAEVGFGEVDLRRRAEGQINLVHGGAAAVEIGRIAIRGNQASDFTITANGCQGITLAAGRRCRLIVSFAPSEPGRREATLIIADNTPTGERRIPLTGFGRTPAVARLQFDPEFLDFGERAPNAPPLLRGVLVRNSGRVDVRMGRAAIFEANARNFSINSNSCQATLRREASCRITVAYRALAAGAHDAVLRIEFDRARRDIGLRGHASAKPIPIAGFAPRRLDFGEQILRGRGGSRDVTVQNRGTGELVITRVEISGSNSFAVANRCTTPIRERASCMLRVSFSPSTRGRQSAVLLVGHNAANSPQRIPLSGVGALPATPNIDVNRERLQFGDQTAGTTSAAQTVTITSTGAAPLAIRAVSIEGRQAANFTMRDDCANRVLSPRERCQISLRFAPKAQVAARAASTKQRTAALVINHNAARSPRRITANGTAVIKPTKPVIPRGLKVDPDIRVFGSGWCCTNGSVQKSTRAQCAEKKGSFFADQQSAQSRCIPVIR